MLGMEDSQQLVSLDHKNCGRRDSGDCTHPARLAGHAAFTEKVTGTEHCDDGFFAGPIDHRQFHSTLLDVHHSICDVTLRVDGFASAIVLNLSRRARRIEKGLCVESSIVLCFPGSHSRLKRPGTEVRRGPLPL